MKFSQLRSHFAWRFISKSDDKSWWQQMQCNGSSKVVLFFILWVWMCCLNSLTSLIDSEQWKHFPEITLQCCSLCSARTFFGEKKNCEKCKNVEKFEYLMKSCLLSVPAGEGRISSQIEHLCFAAMLCWIFIWFSSSVLCQLKRGENWIMINLDENANYSFMFWTFARCKLN